MAFASPRYVLFKSNRNNEYLGFKHESGESYGYLKCSETQVLSPYAKFEVEMAKSGGTRDLVHIRSCQNNKYWVSGVSYITATANKEEDQSNKLCTLFKLLSVDDAANKVRIMHVQSRKYLWIVEGIWRVSAVAQQFDEYSRDIFTVIDWESLVILPRHVAFKGDNDQYLRLVHFEGHAYAQASHKYLVFSSDDIGDSSVPMEIFMTTDGNIRIKPTSSNKFWRRTSNSIWADSDDTSSNNKDTLFRPFKVDNQTIALRNLGNNKFCSKDGDSYLTANVSSITKEVQLRVEKPVLESKIYHIKYDLDNSRIYDESVLVKDTGSVSNNTQKSGTFSVKLSYTDTKTRAWNTNFSLTTGRKVSMDLGLPNILEGHVELSFEIQSGVEWGTSETTTTEVDVVHQVIVPAMTKVTVNLIATIGKCDVPFTFRQKETLCNGDTTITEVQGGTYTGSSYYNVEYETKAEPLSS